MDVSALKIDRTAPTKRTPRPRRGSPWPLRVVVLGALVGAGWLFRTPITSTLDRVRLPQVRVVQVVESHPAAAGAVAGTAANGHIVAARRAALSADTPGRIVELAVTEGSVVKEGDLVARLYADEYAAALRRAEAEVATAGARVKRAEAAVTEAEAQLTQRQSDRQTSVEQVAEAVATRTLAQEEFARAKSLRERGVNSQAVLDSARATLDTATAQVRAAEARQRAADSGIALAQARCATATTDLATVEAEVQTRIAERDQAAATLEKTEVRAPFDGIVVLKDAEVGEVVSPNSQGGSNARGSVCTMVDLDSLEAQAEVPETSLAAVQQGAPAQVFLDAFPEAGIAGVVDRIWPTANRQTATVEVRVRLLTRDERVRPEMGVRVVFQTDEDAAAAAARHEPAKAVILLPEEAVVRTSGSNGVFVLERGVVELRSVEVGERRAGRVAVLSGLTPGERVVVAPPDSLQSGDRVRTETGS
ncbi:MAG: efflux RND transporter periplasmic adaptor subunit [Planctomycetota bacterium]